LAEPAFTTLFVAPENMIFTGLRLLAAAPTPPGTPAWRVTAALLRFPVTYVRAEHVVLLCSACACVVV